MSDVRAWTVNDWIVLMLKVMVAWVLALAVIVGPLVFLAMLVAGLLK